MGLGPWAIASAHARAVAGGGVARERARSIVPAAHPGLVHLDRVRMHYDGEADGYEGLYAPGSRDAGSYIVKARRAEVLKELGGIARGRLLDVGCGPGPLVADLTGRGFEYEGVDLSPRMIHRCRERHAGLDARFTVAEASALPFPDETFDVVLCLGVLEYVLRPFDSLCEVARVLRPGGTMILSSLNRRALYWCAYRLRRARWVTRVLGPAREVEACPATQYSSRQLCSLVRASGMATRKLTYYGPVVFFGPLRAGFAANATLAAWRAANGAWSSSAFLLVASRGKGATARVPALPPASSGP
ncbi:MAG: class I SAM-dependent methyltransferase [Myxococcales bacterium]|nr:class I SAM-dependent methyltransferase [Myxococcales bacterium]